MTAVRSLIFNIAFLTTTAIAAALFMPSILISPAATRRCARAWGQLEVWLTGWLGGIDAEIRGRDRLPPGPAIVASRHESAWDTMVFLTLLPRMVYVLKKELLSIPLFGALLRHGGEIAIDRRGGGAALRQMLRDAKAATAADLTLVIFPEGTRVAPGESLPYLPGVAALYLHLRLPVVPVALTSGRHWGRRSFLKRPGRILLEFQEPIPPGLGREAFESLLRSRIEDGCRRLAAE